MVRDTAAVLGAPYVAVDVTMAVLATAYGFAFIVTARRPHRRQPDGYRLRGHFNPSSQALVWLGLCDSGIARMGHLCLALPGVEPPRVQGDPVVAASRPFFGCIFVA